jgi:hypothetical protein
VDGHSPFEYSLAALRAQHAQASSLPEEGPDGSGEAKKEDSEGDNGSDSAAESEGSDAGPGATSESQADRAPLRAMRPAPPPPSQKAKDAFEEELEAARRALGGDPEEAEAEKERNALVNALRAMVANKP